MSPGELELVALAATGSDLQLLQLPGGPQVPSMIISPKEVPVCFVKCREPETSRRASWKMLQRQLFTCNTMTP